MLRRWIKDYQADDNGQAFRGNGKLTPEQEEFRRLKLKNKQLKLEKKCSRKRRPSLRKKRNEKFVHHPKEVAHSSWPDVSAVEGEPWYLLCLCPMASRLFRWFAPHETYRCCIRNIAISSYYTYGSRRIKEALNAWLDLTRAGIGEVPLRWPVDLVQVFPERCRAQYLWPNRSFELHRECPVRYMGLVMRRSWLRSITQQKNKKFSFVPWSLFRDVWR